MFQNLYGDHRNSKAVPIDIKNSIGNDSGLASCQVWEAGHSGESSKHPRKFRVGKLNVNTLEWKSL